MRARDIRRALWFTLGGVPARAKTSEKRPPVRPVESSNDLLLFQALGNGALLELDADAVDAVSLVRRRHPLPLEHVPEVTPALPAHDLHPPHAVGVVRLGDDGALEALVERWPAAPAVVFRTVREKYRGRCVSGWGRQS